MRSLLLHPLAKPLVFVLCLLPLAWLVFGAINDQLGANPAEALIRSLGDWTLRFLCLTLAVTPLRVRTRTPQLARYRRMLGLFTFFYACLHLLAYLGLDVRGYWTQIFEEIVKRPYITVGFAAWLLLVPLAITSTKGWIKRLGRNWARLHKLVYVICVLVILHFWWLVKSDIREPLLYASILALLLGWRGWKWFSRRRKAAAH